MAEPTESEPLLPASSEQEPIASVSAVDEERERALEDFKQKLLEHRNWDAKLKDLRLNIRGLQKDYEKTEDV